MRCKVILNDIVYDFDKPITEHEHEPLALDKVPVEWMSIVTVKDMSDAAHEAAFSLTEYTGWRVMAAQYTVTQYKSSGRKGETLWGSFVTFTPETRAANA